MSVSTRLYEEYKRGPLKEAVLRSSIYAAGLAPGLITALAFTGKFVKNYNFRDEVVRPVLEAAQEDCAQDPACGHEQVIDTFTLADQELSAVAQTQVMGALGGVVLFGLGAMIASEVKLRIDSRRMAKAAENIGIDPESLEYLGEYTFVKD